jgi:D-glycero-D-manno-heptose 1,7-bisphosphate phosphatase
VKKRAVFLDRDGVINRYAYRSEFGTIDSPAHPAEFSLLDGAGEGIAALNRIDLPVIVISNQPGIAKGKFSPALLDAINEEMRAQLARHGARVDAIYYCRHHPEGTVPEYRTDCDCRKPKPGLFVRAAAERNLDLAACFGIGDGVPDVLAGRAAGVTTLLLAPTRCTVCEEFAARGAVPDLLVRDLLHAAGMIRAALDGSADNRASNDSPAHLDSGACVLARAGANFPRH